MTLTSELFRAAADLERRLGLLGPDATSVRYPRTRSSAVLTLAAVAALVALLALGVAGAGHRAAHDPSGTTRPRPTSDTTAPLRVRQLERDPLR